MSDSPDYAANFRLRIKKTGATFNLIARSIGRRSSSLGYALTATDSETSAIMVDAAEKVLQDLESGALTLYELKEQIKEANA